MANTTTKKTSTSTKKTETKTDNAVTSDIEVKPVVDSTEKENEVLKAQILALQEQMAQLISKQSSTVERSPKSRKDRMIKFVNMTNGLFVLRGSQIWTIEGQFNSRSFSEREALVILNNMRNSIQSGNIYIVDADFVEENDLLDAYQYILSDKELSSLFEKDSQSIIETYKMVSDRQKEIIINMVVSKRLRGETVDGNVLVTLGQLSGKNLVEVEPLED